MFSSREYLDKKTGPYGVGRLPYLQSLVTEFQDSDSEGAKLEVLGNLANFSYDPINYDHIRKLNIIRLFLDCLSSDQHSAEKREQFVEFAIGGLCNSCLDKENKDIILRNNGVSIVKNCLSSSKEEVVLSAISTLMFLVTPASKTEITDVSVIDAMLQFSSSTNTRLRNLATVFLQDYCTREQVGNARKLQADWDQQVQHQAAAATKTV